MSPMEKERLGRSKSEASVDERISHGVSDPLLVRRLFL